MRRFLIPSLLSVLLLMVAVGCEKPVIIQGEDPDEPVVEVEGTRRVRFSVSPLVQTAFDNAAEAKAREPRHAQKNLGEVCTRLSLAVFNQDGDKVGTMKNQQVDDKDFGSFDLSLADGKYTVVILAHSGDANFSGSSLSKFTANYKVTDTFYYCGDISIDAQSEDEYTFELHRCVAKVHIIFTEPLDEKVSQVQFTYTGGSSTLDVSTGYGSVNSKQNEVRNVTNHSHPEFDLYTYPHADEGSLNIRVDALGASGETLLKKELSEVPVRKNYVTRVEGDFFGEHPDDGRGKVIITIDDTWEGSIPYYF